LKFQPIIFTQIVLCFLIKSQVYAYHGLKRTGIPCNHISELDWFASGPFDM